MPIDRRARQSRPHWSTINPAVPSTGTGARSFPIDGPPVMRRMAMGCGLCDTRSFGAAGRTRHLAMDVSSSCAASVGAA